MTNKQFHGDRPRFVSITDLAAEFGKDFRATSRWLLQHDIMVGRRAILGEATQCSVAVVTEAEASEARFLHAHGVLLQEDSR